MGTPSTRAVLAAVKDWISAHPNDTVTELTLDLREVDYRWGDGPAVIAVLARAQWNIARTWLDASDKNRAALTGIVQSLGLGDRIALLPRRPP